MAIGVDGDAQKDLNATEKETPLAGHIFQIWSFVGRSREACYQMINTLTNCPADLYRSSFVPSTFMVSMFSQASNISLYHWRTIIVTALIPFIIHCPIDCFERVIAVCIPDLASYLNTQVKSVWTVEMMASTQDLELDSDDCDLSDEVVQERMLRSFTRSYAELWTTVFSLSVDVKTSLLPGTAFRYPELVQFLMLENNMVSQWTTALILLLAVKDTAAVHSCLSTSIHLIQFLATMPPFHFFVGDTLLKSALGVLSDGYQSANHGESIHLIIEIYTTLRPLSNVPFETLAALPGMQLESINVPILD